MVNFKEKKQVKILNGNKNNSLITLDNKHIEIINDIEKKEQKLPKYYDEKKKYKKLLKNKDLSIEEKLDYQDKIKELKKKIRNIKNEKKLYYLDNSKFIFEYFQNKKEISSGNNKTRCLNEFFKLGNNNIHGSDNDNDNENENENENENSNIEKYMMNVDSSNFDFKNFVKNTDICKRCNNGELIPVENEGALICNNCAYQIKYLIENEKPSYKEPPKEVCFYAYKRINHFREILAQFQAKETTQIPDIVIEDIKNQIKKERIDLSHITNKKAKEILKKLGYNKYYEHIPFIKDKLGIKPPVMTAELEETLCNLFIDIQAPYAKYCPDDRVNFLNYYYTIYKLCELLSKNEFLPYFPMLKDREKRIEQDQIWKNICNDLGWKFISTV